MEKLAENRAFEILEEAVVHAECELEVAEAFLNDEVKFSSLQVMLENLRRRLGTAQVQASERAHEERQRKSDAARMLGEVVLRLGSKADWETVRDACALVDVELPPDEGPAPRGVADVGNTDVQGIDPEDVLGAAQAIAEGLDAAQDLLGTKGDGGDHPADWKEATLALARIRYHVQTLRVIAGSSGNKAEAGAPTNSELSAPDGKPQEEGDQVVDPIGPERTDSEPRICIAQAGTASEVIRYMEQWANVQLGERIGKGEVAVQMDEVELMQGAVDELLDVLTDADLPNGCGEDADAYRALLRLNQTIRRMKPRESRAGTAPRKFLVVVGQDDDGLSVANIYWGTTLNRRLRAKDPDALAEKIMALDLEDMQVLNPDATGEELFDVDMTDMKGAAE